MPLCSTSLCISWAHTFVTLTLYCIDFQTNQILPPSCVVRFVVNDHPLQRLRIAIWALALLIFVSRSLNKLTLELCMKTCISFCLLVLFRSLLFHNPILSIRGRVSPSPTMPRACTKFTSLMIRRSSSYLLTLLPFLTKCCKWVTCSRNILWIILSLRIWGQPLTNLIIPTHHWLFLSPYRGLFPFLYTLLWIHMVVISITLWVDPFISFVHPYLISLLSSAHTHVMAKVLASNTKDCFHLYKITRSTIFRYSFSNISTTW